jgi:arylsulfatase A-like enzyme
MLRVYGERGPDSANYPPTPNIDALRANGVLFRNAYANPFCSPTRATVQAGRYGFRTGVGFVTPPGSNPANALPLAEHIVPEVIDLSLLADHSHAAIGKWHLSNDTNGGIQGPTIAGYDYYAGALFNLGPFGGYFNWTKTVNQTDGTAFQFTQTVYATTDTVNETVSFINAQQRPWFVWMAFNAPHAPYHIPPDELHTYDIPCDPGDPCATEPSHPCPDGQTRQCYEAMIQAMDTEIGRLLNAIPEQVLDQTTIVFMGDNGTPGGLPLPPFDPNRAKGTVFEGGINVPMIISGAQVANPNRESPALVNTTDLFTTVVELTTGRDARSLVPSSVVLDSHSLMPILRGGCLNGTREWVFSEIFFATGTRDDKAIRNSTYKLIRFNSSGEITEQFYNLVADPFENDNILSHATLTPNESANLTRLRSQLTVLLNNSSRCGPCVVSYCNGLQRCTFSGTCGPSGCCNYNCVGDASCEGVVDPVPVNACRKCKLIVIQPKELL